MLGSGGRPDIESVRVQQVNSPYYTKPNPVASRVDTLNPVAGTVALVTIACRAKGGYTCACACMVLRKYAQRLKEAW